MSPPVCLLYLAVACSAAASRFKRVQRSREDVPSGNGEHNTQSVTSPCPSIAQLLLSTSSRGFESCTSPRAEAMLCKTKHPASHLLLVDENKEHGKPAVMHLRP